MSTVSIDTTAKAGLGESSAKTTPGTTEQGANDNPSDSTKKDNTDAHPRLVKIYTCNGQVLVVSSELLLRYPNTIWAVRVTAGIDQFFTNMDSDVLRVILDFYRGYSIKLDPKVNSDPYMIHRLFIEAKNIGLLQLINSISDFLPSEDRLLNRISYIKNTISVMCTGAEAIAKAFGKDVLDGLSESAQKYFRDSDDTEEFKRLLFDASIEQLTQKRYSPLISLATQILSAHMAHKAIKTILEQPPAKTKTPELPLKRPAEIDVLRELLSTKNPGTQKTPGNDSERPMQTVKSSSKPQQTKTVELQTSKRGYVDPAARQAFSENNLGGMSDSDSDSDDESRAVLDNMINADNKKPSQKPPAKSSRPVAPEDSEDMPVFNTSSPDSEDAGEDTKVDDDSPIEQHRSSARKEPEAPAASQKSKIKVPPNTDDTERPSDQDFKRTLKNTVVKNIRRAATTSNMHPRKLK